MKPRPALPRSTTPRPNPPRHPVLPDTRTVNLEESIAAHAYALWQNYGEPTGRSLDIWLEAEAQILGANSNVNHQPAGAVSAPGLDQATAPAPRSFDSTKADVNGAPSPSKP